MGEMFLKKILDKDFGAITTEELKAITANEDILQIPSVHKCLSY